MDLDKVPTVDQMIQNPGKKDGEIKVFKTAENVPKAYMWKGAERVWEEVGDVIMPGGSAAA